MGSGLANGSNAVSAIDPRRLAAGLLILLSALSLSGCATSPFAERGAVAPFGPADALRGNVALGQRVLWGGRIVGVSHTERSTEVEMLALPLDRVDRPRASAEGGVRFVVRYRGFLEPVNHAPGRLLTALGRFDGVTSRAVGEFEVEQPVLEATQVELWPIGDRQPRTQIGIGIGVRL